ncbi:hypothetical protein PoB_002015800 [Plakobranchus ocellatus]|uniref:Uncharacterized protein n=1 Tax=Plakobranchus ocellatus TaxID=259542 RepID=A0AAV3ZGR5_9GAST|nr:hypothetical protein PoB_002015800 [Plakobranchus ocellatus]
MPLEAMLAYERYTGTTQEQKTQRKTKAKYFDNVKDWTRKYSTEIFTTIERKEDWREMTTEVERASNIPKMTLDSGRQKEDLMQVFAYIITSVDL